MPIPIVAQRWPVRWPHSSLVIVHHSRRYYTQIQINLTWALPFKPEQFQPLIYELHRRGIKWRFGTQNLFIRNIPNDLIDQLARKLGAIAFELMRESLAGWDKEAKFIAYVDRHGNEIEGRTVYALTGRAA